MRIVGQRRRGCRWSQEDQAEEPFSVFFLFGSTSSFNRKRWMYLVRNTLALIQALLTQLIGEWKIKELMHRLRQPAIWKVNPRGFCKIITAVDPQDTQRYISSLFVPIMLNFLPDINNSFRFQMPPPILSYDLRTILSYDLMFEK